MSLEKVLCDLACRDLIHLFGLALDENDNDRALQLTSDDFATETSDGEWGVHEARARLLGRSPTNFTRHLISNVTVTPTGKNTARGAAYLIVYRVPAGAGLALPLPLPKTPQGVGQWRFEFRETKVGWRISRWVIELALAPEAA